MQPIEAIVWEYDGGRRVLAPELSSGARALCLLRATPGWSSVQALCRWMEYGNLSRFRTKILPPLHRKRLIVFDRANDRVSLTPLGEEQYRVRRISTEHITRGDRSADAASGEPSTGMPSLAVLCELLEALFSAEELWRFVTLRYPDLAVDLVERDSLAGMAFAVVRGLERHNLVTAELFAGLAEIRPRQHEVIAACAIGWGIAPPS